MSFDFSYVTNHDAIFASPVYPQLSCFSVTQVKSGELLAIEHPCAELAIGLVQKDVFFSGCHTAEDEEFHSRRKRRQVNVIDPDNTRVLRQYFSDCLRSGVSF